VERTEKDQERKRFLKNKEKRRRRETIWYN